MKELASDSLTRMMKSEQRKLKRAIGLVAVKMDPDLMMQLVKKAYDNPDFHEKLDSFCFERKIERLERELFE